MRMYAVIAIQLLLHVAAGATTNIAGREGTAAGNLATDEMETVFTGPISFSFLTTSTIVVSERTSLSLVDLESNTKTLIIGSSEMGGYVDGPADEARFSLVNDVAVAGNYIYIADYSCVRVYDIERKLVGTLTGTCGRMDDPLTTTIMPPIFTSHLKLAVSARYLYVLEGEKVYRVDKETGLTTVLSVGRHLSGGFPSSIAVDRYTSQIFVSVVTVEGIKVVAVDELSGTQSLYSSISSQKSTGSNDLGLTAMVASVTVAPGGEIFVLDPTKLHSINRMTLDIRTNRLKDYGYHEVAVSSLYILMSQEFYSRMYRLHVVKRQVEASGEVDADGKEYGRSSNTVTDFSRPVLKASMTDEAAALRESLQEFQKHTLYLAVIFPSVLFILIITLIGCVTNRLVRLKRQRSRSHPTRPDSDILSEKYFLNQDGNQWI